MVPKALGFQTKEPGSRKAEDAGDVGMCVQKAQIQVEERAALLGLCDDKKRSKNEHRMQEDSRQMHPWSMLENRSPIPSCRSAYMATSHPACCNHIRAKSRRDVSIPSPYEPLPNFFSRFSSGLLFLFPFDFETASCSLAWLGTHYATENNLELRNLLPPPPED